MTNEPRVDGLAIAAVICGALGVFILALAFGFTSLARIRRHDHLEGAPLAYAAIILGFLPLALIPLMVLLMINRGIL